MFAGIMRRLRARRSAAGGSVAFLFLGELFLIPHLLPIAVALMRGPSPPKITLFVITSVHEEILLGALSGPELAGVTVRRAWGFRRLPDGARKAPKLPWKPLVLVLNALAILRHDVVVVAERTSLWLPRLARTRARFIYNEHGAGPHANFASRRNRYAARILMPGTGMAERCCSGGVQATKVAMVGYIKRDYLRDRVRSSRHAIFAQPRTTIVYVPHWLREKSSWWSMGEQVLKYFARSDRYNLILAPHLRLPEKDRQFEARVGRFRDLPNIHIDSRSFALIDQSYIDAADVYLGCGSSQIVEFAERPRPVILLNPDGVAWQSDPRFSHWQMGEVVNDIGALDVALARASSVHPGFEAIQRAYVARMMGSDDNRASIKAAAVVRSVLAEQGSRRTSSTSSAHPDGRFAPGGARF